VIRRIAIVAYPNVQLVDVVGPLEVFALADRFSRECGRGAAYSAEVVASSPEPVTASNGLTILPGRALAAVRGELDTIIVAGGAGTPVAMRDMVLQGWLQRRARTTRRVASVCSGAFVLAAAGLLDGKRATTHWSECDRLAEAFPETTVERDPIFVRDGNIVTSAGVTAGMDLALALVEEDLGRDLALHVARWMVLFVRRPGGQSQFSAQLAAQQASRGPLREPLAELLSFISEQPAADLSVSALAQRCDMSERNFARVFRREIATTPAEYVERARVEVARRLLEETATSLDAVASTCGFGSIETFRRSFHRVLGVAPSSYRSRFRTAS
jgi:transcriptional regulator GlxA family with amidase domain